MRKVGGIFIVAVFVPCLVLAWLAIRSLRDQQFLVERQRSLLHQGVTDSAAQQVAGLLAARQREFSQIVEEFLAARPAPQAAAAFDDHLRTIWPASKVGFVVTTDGELVCPQRNSRPEARLFSADNASFLANREAAEVYWMNSVVLNAQQMPLNTSLNNAPESAAQSAEPATASVTFDSTAGASPAKSQKFSSVARAITPQQMPALPGNVVAADAGLQNYSKVAPAQAAFHQLIGDAVEGVVSRFVNDQLNVLLWYRSPRDDRHIFGAQLDLSRFADELRDRLPSWMPALQQEICLAILDDRAKPVALSHPDFVGNWRHPFVATEIGEILPHWEAAVYLLNPDQLSQSAHAIRITLGLLIAALIVAVGVGGWLIVADLSRQLTLARQKTDFVSNVSHELKTPLTSIRMFSELLADGRVSDPARQQSYLQIITAETARLTRLINNVLDFSRMERGEKKYDMRDCDLAALVQQTAESYRPHLESNGFRLECSLPDSPIPVRGDCDAIAQVLLNLLSNAEKYSNGTKEIAIDARVLDGSSPCAEVRIQDRGLGVPRGCEQKIFEKFFRAHDSLSGGIQGCGLGLTLARQIARAHGGDIHYEAREGGGSCFSLRLPLGTDHNGSA